MNQIGTDCKNIIMSYNYQILFNDVLCELKNVYIHTNKHLIYGKCDMCNTLNNIRPISKNYSDIRYVDNVCLMCHTLLVRTPPNYNIFN